MAHRAPDLCCYLLGFIFSTTGSIKLYPWNAEVHRHMVTKFSSWKDVFLLSPFGFTPDPAVYRTAVGVLEVTLAFLVTFGSLRVRRVAAGGIMFVMAGAIHTLVCSREMTDIAPAIVCLLMSGFVVYSTPILSPMQTWPMWNWLMRSKLTMNEPDNSDLV